MDCCFYPGDPCLLSLQSELNEAIELYEHNKDTKISIHGELKRIGSFSVLCKFSFAYICLLCI